VNEDDLLDLIRGGVPGPGGVWADLGSGDGAFTLALDELVGPDAEIWSVDRDGRALGRQRLEFERRRPAARVNYLEADFARPLALPPLDGIVMANSLHFQRDKRPVLARVHGYLKLEGRLILVEYDADHGNPWVPYPLSYPTWERLASAAGFRGTRLLHRVPSRHLGAIYSAVSYR
jgi:ubiquinone/menaquinone biosynthesis C-methylase UbiE